MRITLPAVDHRTHRDEITHLIDKRGKPVGKDKNRLLRVRPETLIFEIGHLQAIDGCERRRDASLDMSLSRHDLVVKKDPNWKLETLVRHPIKTENGRADKLTQSGFDLGTPQWGRLVRYLFFESSPLARQKLILFAGRRHETSLYQSVDLRADAIDQSRQVVACVFDQQARDVIDRTRNVRQLPDEIKDFSDTPGQSCGAGNNDLNPAQIPPSIGSDLTFAGKVRVDLVKGHQFADVRFQIVPPASPQHILCDCD